MHYKQYKYGIRWNALEAINTQGLLAINQFMLFRILPLEFYGLTGLIFSLIYVALPLINLGFDASLPTFIKKYTADKQSFATLLMPQLYAQAMTILIATFVYSFTLITINTVWFSSTQYLQLSSAFFVLLAGIIITESIKKTLRALTHAYFLNKQTTLIELGAVILYTVLVWGNYFMYGTLNLWTIFIPLFIESCFGSLALMILIKRTYNMLQAQAKQQEHVSITRIWKNRLSVYVNQLSMIFFSRNFLILFLRCSIKSFSLPTVSFSTIL